MVHVFLLLFAGELTCSGSSLLTRNAAMPLLFYMYHAYYTEYLILIQLKCYFCLIDVVSKCVSFNPKARQGKLRRGEKTMNNPQIILYWPLLSKK